MVFKGEILDEIWKIIVKLYTLLNIVLL